MNRPVIVVSQADYRHVVGVFLNSLYFFIQGSHACRFHYLRRNAQGLQVFLDFCVQCMFFR